MTRMARYEKHVGLANAIAGEFTLPGSGREDVHQEARRKLRAAA